MTKETKMLMAIDKYDYNMAKLKKNHEERLAALKKNGNVPSEGQMFELNAMRVETENYIKNTLIWDILAIAEERRVYE